MWFPEGMKKIIDLSKLKELELPTKEIEVDILGEAQKTVVTAMPMTFAVKIANLAELPIQ